MVIKNITDNRRCTRAFQKQKWVGISKMRTERKQKNVTRIHWRNNYVSPLTRKTTRKSRIKLRKEFLGKVRKFEYYVCMHGRSKSLFQCTYWCEKVVNCKAAWKMIGRDSNGAVCLQRKIITERWTELKRYLQGLIMIHLLRSKYLLRRPMTM